MTKTPDNRATIPYKFTFKEILLKEQITDKETRSKKGIKESRQQPCYAQCAFKRPDTCITESSKILS